MKALDKKLNHRNVVCFLDFEGTQFSHEIIAYGCVKVHLKRDGTIKKYTKGIYSLVLAKNKIGKIVTDLTGITEEMMKTGKPFRVALEDIKKYMGRDFKKAIYVTYGSHDMRMLEQSMQHNLDASKEIYRQINRNHFDYDAFINEYVRDDNGNTYSLANLLKIFNVDFKGIKHNPLADALNLAYLYNAFLQNPDIVESEYKKVLAKGKHLPTPVQCIIAKLNKGEVVTPEDYHQFVVKSLQ